MANIKRPVTERGVVLSKTFKKAISEFKTSDGNVVPAQPDRFVVTVASSYACTKDEGLCEPTILDYKVTQDVFAKLKYLSEVEVTFELSTSGSNKAIELMPIA